MFVSLNMGSNIDVFVWPDGQTKTSILLPILSETNTRVGLRQVEPPAPSLYIFLIFFREAKKIFFLNNQLLLEAVGLFEFLWPQAPNTYLPTYLLPTTTYHLLSTTTTTTATIYYPLPTTHCLLPTAYCLLPTTYLPTYYLPTYLPTYPPTHPPTYLLPTTYYYLLLPTTTYYYLQLPAYLPTYPHT